MNRRKFLTVLSVFISSLLIRKPAKAVTVTGGEPKSQMMNPPKKLNRNSKVVSVHSNNVTYWDYNSYPYVDFIDNQKVKTMLDKGLMALTGTTKPRAAWNLLFSSYTKNDLIAIKPNLNDMYAKFFGFLTSPTLIKVIVDGLNNYLGVMGKQIIIYDCSRSIPDFYRDKIDRDVKYVEGWGSSLWRRIKHHTFENLSTPDYSKKIDMLVRIKNDNGDPVQCYLPKCLSKVKHIINLPILQSHQFVLATGALKNHYGTVRFSDGIGYPKYLHPPIIHEAIAAINADPDIKSKTRLIVMDALFGRLSKKGGMPQKWQTFENKSPQRLFLSYDPVALDAITAKIIRKELQVRSEEILSDEYLTLAEKLGVGTKTYVTVKEVKV